MQIEAKISGFGLFFPQNRGFSAEVRGKIPKHSVLFQKKCFYFPFFSIIYTISLISWSNCLIYSVKLINSFAVISGLSALFSSRCLRLMSLCRLSAWACSLSRSYLSAVFLFTPAKFPLSCLLCPLCSTFAISGKISLCLGFAGSPALFLSCFHILQS